MFGHFYLDLGKLPPEPVRQSGAHRMFRPEVTGVNEIQPQIPGVPELVVLHVRRHKGVAACVKDRPNSVPASAAPHSHPCLLYTTPSPRD